MSATQRYREGCLPIFLLAGFLALAPGATTGWAAVRGGPGGGHVGGARIGMAFPGTGFAAGRFAGRRFGDRRFAHRGGFFPSFLYGDPYWYGYDEDYGYDPRYSYAPSPRGYQHSGYCDVTSHSYPQFCVWKEGP